MILGSGSHQAGRRRFLLQAATGAAGMLLGVVLLSGCGGGGGPDPNPSPSSSANAIVRGRLIENNTSANIAGATVNFNGASVTTGADGVFSFQVPAGTAAGPLTITPPSGFFSFGFIRGQQVSLATGVNVSSASNSQNLSGGQTVDFGDIKLFSSDGPPPPPVF